MIEVPSARVYAPALPRLDGTGAGSRAAANVHAGAERDVALDLLRGLAMAVLVVNHVHLESGLDALTGTFLSAAEVLVAVSGVVVGMVFGRRWRTRGARAATRALLRRSRKLYVASVAVVGLVGLLTLVPGLATEVLTVSPRHPDVDSYAFDGTARTLVAVVTLEAGPWQFNILGFFIAALALAPLVLWALARGWWAAVIAASLAVFVVARPLPLEVLPSQSERPFPFLVWQVLFVPGMVIGWHRERLAELARRSPRAIATTLFAAAIVALHLQMHLRGFDPVGINALLGLERTDWLRWDAAVFDKTSLDPLRLATMLSIAGALYALARRYAALAVAGAGRLLLPLGRNSFYVFIMHVFLCLALASIPGLAGDGIGPAGNLIVQVGCLALLWVMVRQRFLFRWVPR